MNNKPILDACCGSKMFYFDKHDPRVLFQDIRDVETTLCDGRHFEVKPDVQADFTNMPYPDDSFAMVVFDPPHLQGDSSGWQKIKYGHLGDGCRDLLAKGFAECFRVLKPGGFLIFKWNETDIKVTEILKLTPAKPIFGHISGKPADLVLVQWVPIYKALGRDKTIELVKNNVSLEDAMQLIPEDMRPKTKRSNGNTKSKRTC